MSGTGGVNLSSAVGDIVNDVSPNVGIGNAGVPSVDMSMRGLVGIRGREPEVAFEADEPGRFGSMRVARGASSESDPDEDDEAVDEEDADSVRLCP